MRDRIKTIWQRVISYLRGYQREYFDYIYYLYRYVSMKGIASHGAFNLEQPEVYVDVWLTSAAPDELNVGVVPQPKTNGVSSDKENIRLIWQYIDKEAKTSNKLILVGSPGSGKTTVLKQIALAFCRFRTKYNLPARSPYYCIFGVMCPKSVVPPMLV